MRVLPYRRQLGAPAPLFCMVVSRPQLQPSRPGPRSLQPSASNIRPTPSPPPVLLPDGEEIPIPLPPPSYRNIGLILFPGRPWQQTQLHTELAESLAGSQNSGVFPGHLVCS